MKDGNEEVEGKVCQQFLAHPVRVRKQGMPAISVRVKLLK